MEFIYTFNKLCLEKKTCSRLMGKISDYHATSMNSLDQFPQHCPSLLSHLYSWIGPFLGVCVQNTVQFNNIAVGSNHFASM